MILHSSVSRLKKKKRKKRKKKNQPTDPPDFLDQKGNKLFIFLGLMGNTSWNGLFPD